MSQDDGSGGPTLDPPSLRLEEIFGDDPSNVELEGYLTMSTALKSGVEHGYENHVPCLAMAAAAADVLHYVGLRLVQAARSARGEAGEKQAREALSALLQMIAEEFHETDLVRLAPSTETAQ